MQRALCLFTVLALMGCDTDPPPLPADARVMRRDTGTTPDGGRRDGGPDSGLDAGPPADGGDDAGMDGGSDGGPPPMVDCTVLDDPPMDLGLDRRAEERPPAVVAGTDHFGIAWIAQDAIQDVVRFVRVGSGSGMGSTVELGTVGLTTDSAALARFSDGDFLVGWTDNDEGNFEVVLRSVSASGVVGARRVLTTDPGRDDGVALLATGADAALVSWVRSNAVDSTLDGLVQSVDASGTASGSANSLGLGVPLALVDESSGPAAYWRNGLRAESRDIGASGFTGMLRRLDTEENAAGDVSGTRVASFHAAAFPARVGVRSELRFRPLDADGVARAPERQITPPPEQGFGVALGSFAGGVAAAYRSSDPAVSEPTVRLRFLSDLGEVRGTFDVANTTTAGGEVAFGVAGDGRMLVAWGTPETDGTRYRAARVECTDAF
ncbi:MAG: hypothetical protein AB8I08_04230 [Sandaracinaceae bacterium]